MLPKADTEVCLWHYSSCPTLVFCRLEEEIFYTSISACEQDEIYLMLINLIKRYHLIKCTAVLLNFFFDVFPPFANHSICDFFLVLVCLKTREIASPLLQIEQAQLQSLSKQVLLMCKWQQRDSNLHSSQQ